MLQEIIETLTKEELRHLKLFLNRTNSRGDRKDIKLVDLFRNAGEKANEDKFFRKLYPTGEKNAYYRLKNRLTEEIFKSLSALYFDESSDIQSLQLLGLARHFWRLGKHDIASSLLDRAERSAMKYQDFGLVELILTEHIRLRTAYPKEGVRPDALIARRMMNRKNIGLEQEVDDVLGVLSLRVKEAKEEADIEMLLKNMKDTLDAYLTGDKLNGLHELRIRLFHSYHDLLERYGTDKARSKMLRQAYKAFSSEKIFTRERVALQVEMIRKIVQLLMVSEKADKALKYLEELKEILPYAGNQREEAEVFYYAMSFKALRSINPVKAGEIIQEASEQSVFRDDFEHQMLLQATQIRTSFSNGKLEAAQNGITTLRNDRSFKELEERDRLIIESADVLLRFAGNDTVYVKHFLPDTLKRIESREDLKRQAYLLTLINGFANDDPQPFSMKEWKALTGEEDFQTGDLLDYDAWILKYLPRK